MKEILCESLVNFQPNFSEHVKIKRKYKDYDFYNNLTLIKDLLEITYFMSGVEINEDDYEKYIVDDKFLLSISVENYDTSDNYKYLFDAFNVYCSQDNVKYIKDNHLTKHWRNIMRDAYADSTYSEDLSHLQYEERENII